jgi:hypothetical protein
MPETNGAVCKNRPRLRRLTDRLASVPRFDFRFSGEKPIRLQCAAAGGSCERPGLRGSLPSWIGRHRAVAGRALSRDRSSRSAASPAENAHRPRSEPVPLPTRLGGRARSEPCARRDLLGRVSLPDAGSPLHDLVDPPAPSDAAAPVLGRGTTPANGEVRAEKNQKDHYQDDVDHGTSPLQVASRTGTSCLRDRLGALFARKAG